MAGSDGSIYVDTELDTKGFKAGSEEMKGAVKSLESQIKQLGPALKKAVNGKDGGMEAYRTQAKEAEAAIAEMESKLDALGRKQVATEAFKDLSAQTEKAGVNLERLLNKKEMLENRGVSPASTQMKNLAADIDYASREYDNLVAKQQQMISSGTAYKNGSETAEYAQLASRVEQARASLEGMNAQADEASEKGSRIAAAFRQVGSVIGTAAKKVGTGLVSGLRTAYGITKKLVTGNIGYGNSFGKLISGAKRFALTMLGARGVYAILRKAVRSYMDANAELSAQLSNTWSNLGNILGPIITKIINLVSTAISYVVALLKLFGLTAKAANKTASAAGGAEKSAKEAAKTLTGFDEINAMSETSDSSGGGGGGGADVSATVDEATLPDWVQIMVDQLKAGNWKQAADTLTTQLNGMVENSDWKGVGKKIGYYLNGALTFLAECIVGFDWFNLGAKFAEGVNEILTSVDWTNLGTVLSGKFRIILLTAAGFLSNLDWGALATAFSDFAMGFFNGISDAIEAVDWSKLGKNVVQFIKQVNWGGVASAILECLGAVLGGLASFLWGIIGDAWDSVVQWWRDVAYEDGKFTIEGLLNGIWEGIKNIGAWIRDNIFQPFIDGFKSAFGIASPSKVMQEMGGYIIEGLLLGITNTWNGITEWFSTAWETVKEVTSSAWESVKTMVSNAWSSVKETVTSVGAKVKTKVSDTWSDVKSTVSEKLTATKEKAGAAWDSIKTTASNVGNTIKTNASTAWTNVKSSITNSINAAKSNASTAWNSIKSTASTIGSSIASSASTTWSNVKNHISNNLNTAKSNASSAWANMTSTLSSAASSMNSTISSKFASISSTITSKINSAKSTVSSGLASIKSSITSNITNAMNAVKNCSWSSIGSNIVTGIGNGLSNSWTWLRSKANTLASNLLKSVKNTLGIHSPSTIFRDEVGYFIGLGVGEGIEDSESSVLGTVSGIADAISEEFNNGDYLPEISGSEIDASLTGFTDKIVGSFDKLLDKLQAIANNVTFTTPAIAGSIVPYTASARSEQSVASVIDASNDELARAFETSCNRQNALLKEQNTLLRQILNKNTGNGAVAVGAADMLSALERKNRRDGKTIVPVGA